MLGFGPPADRQARREWWRRQLQRQQQSQMTVAEFCRRHCILAVTFYSWKRRFQDNAAAPAASHPMPQPQATPLARAVPPSDDASVPVSIVDARGRTARDRVRQRLHRAAQGDRRPQAAARTSPGKRRTIGMPTSPSRPTSSPAAAKRSDLPPHFIAHFSPTLLQREGRGVVVDHQGARYDSERSGFLKTQMPVGCRQHARPRSRMAQP